MTTTDLPAVTNEGEVKLEPETLLDHRWVKQGGKFLEESLVKWKHLPSKEATWEATDLLLQQFPQLNLEDKVPFPGEGIDTPRRTGRTLKLNPKYVGGSVGFAGARQA